MKPLFVFLLTLLSLASFGQKEISLEELAQHVGDSVLIKGKIYGITYLEQSKNSPTFINVGGKYPNQLLTVVIWGDTRKKFDYDLDKKELASGMATVTGKVEIFKGKPQIVIHDPNQVKIFYDEEVPAGQVPPIEKSGKN
jgi:DNA/RNA endonuclease YhcR with UshA esterase domain